MNRPHLITLTIFLAWPQLVQAENLRPEVPDPASIQAYQQFWRSFDDYENHRLTTNKSQYMEAWDQIRKEFSFQDAKARDTEIDLLLDASNRYKQHLESHPTASNAPFVKLNLAQIQARLASLRDEQSMKTGDENRKVSLAILSGLQRDYPGFTQIEESQYLRATLFEALGQNETAFPIWQALANKARISIYGVHAHLAVGDHFFSKEKPKDALRAYRQGRALLQRIETKDKDYENLRFQYRIAWAAYRSAELDQCVATGIELLEPGRDFHQLSIKRKIEKDAIELVGDALFEKDNMAFTRSTLQNKLIRGFAAAIGYRIMNRQMGFDTKEKLLELGPFLVENYPQAKEMPEILSLLSSVYRDHKMERLYIATLERLSLLLPPNSLWRNHQQSDPISIKNMEEKSLAATQMLAAKFYEQGMEQNTPASFKTALTYYDNLLRSKPQNSEAETWKLRRAHCLYLSDQLKEADIAYEDFRKDRQVSPTNLELAFYQQILTREKIWRQSLQKLTSNRTGPTKDPIVLEKLRKLEQVIDDFADRFPGRPHTIDLLLMAASANRDLDKFSDAEKYWSRTLLSEPAPGQRTLAIRGLVQARIRGGNPEEVVALTRNYLKLENWTELGPAFGYELRGILSTAAKDAGENLNKKGQMSEAGRMLLAITEEFPDLPDYDSIYRDAAYYLALGGAWGEAKHASDKYLASKDAPRSADMLYLKARAQEYQMHFADAASTHLALVEKYPRFSRSSSSVQRAEDLAIAEDDYKTAGKAALLAVQYEKGLDSRYGAYVRASSHFKHEQAWDQAIAALQEAQRISKQASTRMKTKIEMARLLAAKGDAVEAQSIYRQLAQESMKNQENIDKSLYQAVNGEANFQLAEYEKRKFDALLMSDDENPTKERLKEKATLLEKSLALYGKAIASQDPEWASRARYGAGQSAEQMSQSIRSTLAKQERSPEAGENRNLYDQASRWQSLAQEYFSQNLLAKNREPHRYKDSIWIEKSAMKLSGLAPGGPKTEEKTEIPASIGNTTPYMWSH